MTTLILWHFIAYLVFSPSPIGGACRTKELCESARLELIKSEAVAIISKCNSVELFLPEIEVNKEAPSERIS